MRETIKKQLDKLKGIDYIIDEEKNIVYFHKKEPTTLKVGEVYKVEVDDDTLTNTNSILYVNYNQSTLPPAKELKVEVESIVGKYVKVNAITNSSKVWKGYLPISKTIIKDVK